jgi:hypothetical protein
MRSPGEIRSSLPTEVSQSGVDDHCVNELKHAERGVSKQLRILRTGSKIQIYEILHGDISTMLPPTPRLTGSDDSANYEVPYMALDNSKT